MAVSVEKPGASSSSVKSTLVTVKETLESILVAFILAFVFRAFIVEAFIIPTGSMAVTLYGAQLTKTCSHCGYEYALGVSLPSPEDSGRHMGDSDLQLRCPNCNMEWDKFKASELRTPDSGDRILVHKWPFDIGGSLLGPKRWDVTVFKDPRDGTTNFIKRLVGLPGEVLEIIDGDVYAAPLAVLRKEKPNLVEQLEGLRRQVYRHGKEGGDPLQHEIGDGYVSLNTQLLPYLQIQRKTDRAQQALWFNVYDHDFLPNDKSLNDNQLKTRVGWHPVDDAAREAWDTSRRTITFRADGDPFAYVKFDGKPIDDYIAYNDEGGSRGRRPPVGDLRLRFGWTPRAGDGQIALVMNRNQDQWTATLSADGLIELDAELPDAQPARQNWDKKRVDPFPRDRVTSVEFMNVDYRVCVVVDGKTVLTTGDRYKPRVKDLDRYIDAVVKEHNLEGVVKPSEVKIGARHLQGELVHVVLDRDVYYRSQRQTEVRSQADPYPMNPYNGWRGWGTAGQPIMLREGHSEGGQYYYAEYFMCGDNSPASKDSRLWWEVGPHLKRLGEEYQLSTVPEDQLIGKAFFVYWPAGYRAAWAGNIGLIPNFGQMRWVR